MAELWFGMKRNWKPEGNWDPGLLGYIYSSGRGMRPVGSALQGGWVPRPLVSSPSFRRRGLWLSGSVPKRGSLEGSRGEWWVGKPLHFHFHPHSFCMEKAKHVPWTLQTGKSCTYLSQASGCLMLKPMDVCIYIGACVIRNS